MPNVSVLLPFFNAGQWLKEAASSILQDGFNDIELLLLDDGSTDNGLSIARDLARSDPRVCVSTAPNRGIVDTLNRGLAAAKAPLIARMDGDDISLPGRLEAQSKFLQSHPEVAVVDGKVEIFRDDGPLKGGMAAFEAWLNAKESHTSMRASLLIDSPVVHPAVMARKAVIEAVGGYVDEGPEDYHLWLRIVGAGHHIHKLPQKVLRWRDHSTRLTRTDSRYTRPAFFELKWRFLKENRLISRGQTLAVWGAGRAARPWLRSLRQEEWNVSTVVDIDPKKQGTTRHGFPTFPVEALSTRSWDVCLIAVGSRGARLQIKQRLDALGLVQAPEAGEKGYWFVA